MVDGENTTYYDPMFVNVYAMEGDNADMIWETEGLWFETAANASCLFNEKIGPIDRNITDQEDPDRYVGIRKGGEFRIPKLYKDDRVIIYMGSAKGFRSRRRRNRWKENPALRDRECTRCRVSADYRYLLGGRLTMECI